MELMPRFISVNDIENFIGINLIDKFKDEQKANVFIRMTEEQVMMWLNANTFRNINFSKLTDFEKENFEKAIIHQVYYNYRNGLLMYDSGIDPEKGKITDKTVLQDAEICDMTINCLKVCGLFTHAFQNSWRYTRSL